MQVIKNKVQIIGNIGNVPKLKIIKQKHQLVKLSIAVNEKRKYKNGQRYNYTTWHQVVIWGKLAEQVHRLSKQGAAICVNGKLINRTINRPGLTPFIVTEIVANEVIINFTQSAA